MLTAISFQCSVSCGPGTSRRYVSCVNKEGSAAESWECERVPKPSSVKVCQERSCGTWRTGEWSGVSP